MRTRVYAVGLSAMLLASADPAASDREPSGYAIRFRVVPAPGAGVQRLELPAAVLAALRNRDGTDIRVFDARNRLVPIARHSPVARESQHQLSALPLLGSPQTRMGARVSVRLDERGQARIAEVESGPATPGGTTMLGVLLDARAVVGPAEQLDLDAELPIGQPVHLTIEASRDLDSWRPLGERVLYRSSAARLADARIGLGSAGLDGDYLRVTWRATSPLIAPVTIKGAILVSGASHGAVTVPARAPTLKEGHTLDFLAPAAPLASLKVIPASGDGPTPVRILGRDQAEQPWIVLAKGIAAADRTPFATGATTRRIIRIEADDRGSGFSAPPALEIGFAPQAIAFAASGIGPFTMAAGRAGARDVFTDLGTLGVTAAAASARVEGGGLTTALVLSAADENGPARLRTVLWTVLGGAVILLGALAWKASRGGPEVKRQPGTPGSA